MFLITESFSNVLEGVNTTRCGTRTATTNGGRSSTSWGYGRDRTSTLQSTPSSKRTGQVTHFFTSNLTSANFFKHYLINEFLPVRVTSYLNQVSFCHRFFTVWHSCFSCFGLPFHKISPECNGLMVRVSFGDID